MLDGLDRINIKNLQAREVKRKGCMEYKTRNLDHALQMSAATSIVDLSWVVPML